MPGSSLKTRRKYFRSADEIVAEFKNKSFKKEKPKRVRKDSPERVKYQSERRKRWTANNKQRQLATQRAYYAKNKERQRELNYARRKGKKHSRGLIGAERDCRRGIITVDELNRRYGEALKRLNARFDYELSIYRGETAGRRPSKRRV